MNKLLTICPTFNRPDRLKEMLESFISTRSEGTDIVIYLSQDDPQLKKYVEFISRLDFPAAHLIGERRLLVEALNFCFDSYPDYPYYHEINDDHIYHTQGWDSKLISEIETKGQGWGIACGRDMLHDTNWHQGRLPSAMVMSGNIARTLGYIVYPEFRHTYVDDYFRELAEGIGRLFYCPEVIIEHRHFLGGKVQNDDNYRWVMSKGEMQYGSMVYHEWLKKSKDSSILELKEAMERGK